MRKQVLIAIAALAAGTVLAQGFTPSSTTQFRNANGSSAGSSRTIGNMTYFYNADGSSAGTATKVGNTMYYRNANGSSAGSATTMGNSTTFRNANGSSAGSATTFGNNTTFRNANGSSAGSAATFGNNTSFRNANGSLAGTGTTIGNTTTLRTPNSFSTGAATAPGSTSPYRSPTSYSTGTTAMSGSTFSYRAPTSYSTGTTTTPGSTSPYRSSTSYLTGTTTMPGRSSSYRGYSTSPASAMGCSTSFRSSISELNEWERSVVGSRKPNTLFEGGEPSNKTLVSSSWSDYPTPSAQSTASPDKGIRPAPYSEQRGYSDSLKLIEQLHAEKRQSETTETPRRRVPMHERVESGDLEVPKFAGHHFDVSTGMLYNPNGVLDPRAELWNAQMAYSRSGKEPHDPPTMYEQIMLGERNVPVFAGHRFDGTTGKFYNPNGLLDMRAEIWNAQIDYSNENAGL